MNATRERRSAPIWLGVLIALNLAVFARSLFSGGDTVPVGEDVRVHGHLFEFAAEQLRQGHLALWNPHIFSGLPALGDPNAMTLYPTTLLSLVLPLPIAITLGTVTHVVLVGAFTYLWTRRRRLHPLGCLLAATMVSFGAPFFARLYAGHLSALAAMTWVPLTFLAIDHLFERRSTRWVIIGAASVAMQILGGHTQYVFYSSLAAALYVLLRVPRADARGGVMLATAVMGVAGVALAAAQLLPVIDAMQEGARAGTLTYQFASEFSMPWSGILTMLAPGFFGQLAGTTYWGDWYYWEVTPFIGVVGFALAAYGALCGDPEKRQFSLVLCLVFLVLALGSSTPLFALLHAHVPPFDRFRASARALFHFSLFASMLAAVGFDALVRGRGVSRAFVATLLCLTVALAAFAGWIRSSAALGDVANARQNVEHLLQLPPEMRDGEVRRLAGTDETRAERLRRLVRAKDDLGQLRGADAATGRRAFEAYRDALVEAMKINPWQAFRAWVVGIEGYSYPLEEWTDPVAGSRQASFAFMGLVIAAGTCFVAAVLLWRARRSPSAAHALAILGVVEMSCFAMAASRTFPFDLVPPALGDFYRSNPGDYRVYNVSKGNSAMSLGALDVWGYNPLIPARYAEYMAATQGLRRDEAANVFFSLRRVHPSYRMLRLKYVLIPQGTTLRVAAKPPQIAEPMPRLALLHDYEVIPAKDSLLARIVAPSWDPSTTVLLESEPSPPPEPYATGEAVRLVDASTDHLTIEADLARPAILLITDAYSAYWRARALDGSSQSAYEVLPANYVLRAVPLTAGHHALRLEYVPPHYRAGLVISLAALIGLAVAAGVGLRPRSA